ncbi:CvpA family protein [uncultured Bacteroides sp.]|uniref:CvpA family protein n=1 Tax=uncultured Bacteroides sp. TaxID=162156 RepID=UPI002AA6FBB5|nr:CvpA family protein [uncultured Bacteroides sp.]
MTTIDLIIVILIGVGAFRGFLKGLLRQLASILGFFVGLLAARALYASLAEKICPTFTHSMTVAQVIAFLTIWIAIPLLFGIVALLLTKTMEAISLGWLNRLLGAGLGALKYLFMIVLLIGVIEFIDTGNHVLSQTKKAESVLYYPMRNVAGIFFPAAKRVSQQYIF